MNQQKMRFPIGGILMAVLSLSSVISVISSLAMSARYLGALTIVLMVLEVLAFIFLAVTLIIRKQMLITVASGFAALIQLIGLLMSVVSLFGLSSKLIGAQLLQVFVSLLWVLTYAVLAVMSLDKVPALRKLFFLPGVLVLLSKIVTVIQVVVNINLYDYDTAFAIGQIIGTLVGSVLPVVAFFLVGQWLANPYIQQPQYQQPQYRVPQYGQPRQPQYQAPQYNQPQQPGWQGSYGQNPQYQAPQQNPYQPPNQGR